MRRKVITKRKSALLLASFVFLLASVSLSVSATPPTKEPFLADVSLDPDDLSKAKRVWVDKSGSGFHIRGWPMGLTIETSDGSFDGAGTVLYDADWTADASEGGIGRIQIKGVITVEGEDYYLYIRVLTNSGTFIIQGGGTRIIGTFESTGEQTGDLTGVIISSP